MAFKVQVRAYDGVTTADSIVRTTNYPPPPGAGILYKLKSGGSWVTTTPKVHESGSMVSATPKLKVSGAWQG